MLQKIILAIPELFLACIILIVLISGTFKLSQNTAAFSSGKKLLDSSQGDSPSYLWMLGIMALVLTSILVVALGGGKTLPNVGSLFIVDSQVVFFKVLMLMAVILTLVISKAFLLKSGADQFEYLFFLLSATLGMMIMISANDFLTVYIGLEVQSFSLYIMAAFHRNDARSTEASVKYFILGVLASGFLLYGISLIYGFTGTTNFYTLMWMFSAGQDFFPGFIIGMVFVFVGFSFKISAAPFHMWSPDVYEGAPTVVTAFFAAAPKVAAIALLIRILFGPLDSMINQWQPIFIFLSIASMIVGSLGALVQRNIKRLMAYSSIGHVGYILIAMSMGGQEALSSIVIYMIIYVFMTIGVFSCIVSMERKGKPALDIYDLAGFSKTHPFIALALAVFMFSMAGVPPFAGFFAKLLVIGIAVEGEAYALAVIAVLTSVVAAFYYLRLVKIMYFDDVGEVLDPIRNLNIHFVLLLAMFIICGFIFVPEAFWGIPIALW